VLLELARRGFPVVDTDDPGWSTWRPLDGDPEGDRVWLEDRIVVLLDAHDDGDVPLVVSGCVSNQGRFYDRFDAVVLLTAPVDVILERITMRTTNEFGKDDVERRRILDDLAHVEPLLRATATHVLDALDVLSARSPTRWSRSRSASPRDVGDAGHVRPQPLVSTRAPGRRRPRSRRGTWLPLQRAHRARGPRW